MKALAIYHHPVERLGNLRIKADEKFASEIEGNEDFDLLILMGGPMGVYEADKYPFIRKEIELVRRAYSEGKKILGVCLGSQIIAEALGGKVIKGSYGQEVGVQEVSLIDEFKELFGTEKIKVFQLHGDTFSLPRGSRLLAYSEKYFQAFRLGKAVGVQFHVEIDSSIVKEWVETYNLDPSLIEEVKKIEQELKLYSSKLLEFLLEKM
ncbi:GMP synthase [Acidianus hospitalis]|uniref:GMP synthase n=1 Tax=Acidianus hospitalis TaxID=563177 RepID=A0A2T9XA92_9CREN|nr:GMP synthase [Acidianus hospitalis]